MKNTKKKVDK